MLSDKFKTCGLKLTCDVAGLKSFGSGVLYDTPLNCKHWYVLTARHIFQEDSETEFDIMKLSTIKLEYELNGKLLKFAVLQQAELKNSIIDFEADFLILKVHKKSDLTFSKFSVSDQIAENDKDFFAWGCSSANPNIINLFELNRSDNSAKRLSSEINHNPEHLKGISGAGVFHKNRSVLYGIIIKYPNKDFFNSTFECAPIEFSKINSILTAKGEIPLVLEASAKTKIINKSTINITEAEINYTILNLELASRRLKHDIQDDWFHDPLKYIDLLNNEYLFKQFENYFENNSYKSQEAEIYFIPKKQFTLRKAMISPFIDRVIYLAAVGVLAENIDKSLLPNIYSARYNYYSKKQLILNGVEQWKKMKYKLMECAHKTTDSIYDFGCVIEIDLLNFYDNIEISLLHKKLLRICTSKNEKNAADLIKKILTGFYKEKPVGLPQNSDASSLLATFYLNQVDTFMKNHVPAYYRFMDDIKIFCKTKYEARKILQILEEELRRCSLSVNSQKTKIYTFSDEHQNLEDTVPRNHYDNYPDIEVAKILRLRKSNNYTHLNDAFHNSVSILLASFENDVNSKEDNSRKLSFALSSISNLAKRGINYEGNSTFSNALTLAIENLKDKPWITAQVCNVLNLIPTKYLYSSYLNCIKIVLINANYNIYSYQTYQLWLLLARHKCDDIELKKFAVQEIEKNDATSRPVTAAMIIYICSVDIEYRKVIHRKIEQDAFTTYFQNRLALISIRSLEPDLVSQKDLLESLSCSFEFTNKHKNKDLVFIQGFNESFSESEASEVEHLYSL